MPTQKIHPTLSQLVSLDSFPNEIEAIQEALLSVFDRIYVKNLIVSKSCDNSSGYYTFILTTYSPIGINIPIAQEMKLVLNPTNTGATEIPISFDYSWAVLRYIYGFSLDTFDFALRSVLEIFIELAGINESDLLYDVLRAFYPDIDGLQNFIQQFNTAYNKTLSVPASNNMALWEKAETVATEISDLGLDFLEVICNLSLNINGEGTERIRLLFNKYFVDAKRNFEEAIKLRFNASIHEISVGLQFPQKWLRPVYTGIEHVQD